MAGKIKQEPGMIYTLGYGSCGTAENLQQIAQEHGAFVVDIRWSPRARRPEFAEANLKKLLGVKYMHVKGYGNENFRGGPIKLHNPDSAAMQIAPLLQTNAVILLCACGKPDECHRTPAAEHLKAAAGSIGINAEIVNLFGNRSDGKKKPNDGVKQETFF